MHNYLCTLLFTSTDNCFLQWVMCPDGPYTCTINLQLTDSFHGIHDVHKQQDRCTTFGWNLMGETSKLLGRFFWKPMDTYFTVHYRIPFTVYKVATFRYVTCCSYNCSFRQVGGLHEIFLTVWTKTLYPKVPTLHQ